MSKPTSSTKTYPAKGPKYPQTNNTMTAGQRKTVRAAAKRNGRAA